MSVRVGDLVSELRTQSRVLNVQVGDVELVTDGDEAGTLRVGDVSFPWGERLLQLLIPFLKGPNYRYVRGEELQWQRTLIEHHTKKMADATSIWHVEGHAVAGIYPVDAKIIPLVSVAERVVDVFSPDDVVEVLSSHDQVEINVVARSKSVIVPGVYGVESRPADDISSGGVRIILHPGKPKRAPSVQEYWVRRVCTNGMTRTVTGSQINLRGRTVSEVLDEMGNVMRAIYEGLDGSAEAILHAAEVPVPGAVSDFLRAVAREHRVNPRTVLRLQERAVSLPDHPTIYDVTQVVTALANEDGLPAVTRRTLQSIGGILVMDTATAHRCSRCERPLVAA